MSLKTAPTTFLWGKKGGGDYNNLADFFLQIFSFEEDKEFSADEVVDVNEVWDWNLASVSLDDEDLVTSLAAGSNDLAAVLAPTSLPLTLCVSSLAVPGLPAGFSLKQKLQLFYRGISHSFSLLDPEEGNF